MIPNTFYDSLFLKIFFPKFKLFILPCCFKTLGDPTLNATSIREIEQLGNNANKARSEITVLIKIIKPFEP